MADHRYGFETHSYSDLMTAAYLGDAWQVKQWLRSTHPNVEKDTKKHETMLLSAAMRGHADVCQLILDTGVITKDEILWKAMRTACLQGHLHTADIISKYNSSVEFLNPLRISELLLATAVQGQITILMWMATGVGMKQEEALKYAFVAESALGNVKTIQQMAVVIGINSSDVMSHALWAASWNGRQDVVDWLMTHTTANVSRSQVKWSPFGAIKSASLAACHKGHWTIATRLLHRCVSPFTINWATNGLKNTALHCVIWCEENLGVPKLHQACFAGDLSATVTLLKTHNVDIQDAIGQTPLHFACQGGHALVVELLLAEDARTDISDDFNNTPAQNAVKYGNSDMLSMLLSMTDKEMTPMLQSRQGINDNKRQQIRTGLKTFQQQNIQKLTQMLKLMQQQEVEQIDEVAQSVVEAILKPRAMLNAEYKTALTSMLQDQKGGIIMMKYLWFLQSRDLFSNASAQNCYQCIRCAIYELIADEIPMLATALIEHGLYDVIKEELLTVTTNIVTSKQKFNRLFVALMTINNCKTNSSMRESLKTSGLYEIILHLMQQAIDEDTLLLCYILVPAILHPFTCHTLAVINTKVVTKMIELFKQAAESPTLALEHVFECFSAVVTVECTTLVLSLGALATNDKVRHFIMANNCNVLPYMLKLITSPLCNEPSKQITLTTINIFITEDTVSKASLVEQLLSTIYDLVKIKDNPEVTKIVDKIKSLYRLQQPTRTPKACDIIIDSVFEMNKNVGYVLHLMQTEQGPQYIPTVARAMRERWLAARDTLKHTDYRCLCAKTVKRLAGGRIMFDYLQFLRQHNLANRETFSCYHLTVIAISRVTRDLPELSAVYIDYGILDLLHADLELMRSTRAASEQEMTLIAAYVHLLYAFLQHRPNLSALKSVSRLYFYESLCQHLTRNTNDEYAMYIYCFVLVMLVLPATVSGSVAMKEVALPTLANILRSAASDAEFKSRQELPGVEESIEMHCFNVVQAIGAFSHNSQTTRDILMASDVLQPLLDFASATNDAYHKQITHTVINVLLSADE